MKKASNNPQFIMVTTEFGFPLYVAPLQGGEIEVTDNKADAELWNEADTLSSKLSYHQAVTGYKGLTFERI